jgi:hypothetical protein
MSQKNMKCLLKEKDKINPRTCSPAQIKKCHPKAKGHSCLKK